MWFLYSLCAGTRGRARAPSGGAVHGGISTLRFAHAERRPPALLAPERCTGPLAAASAAASLPKGHRPPAPCDGAG